MPGIDAGPPIGWPRTIGNERTTTRVGNAGAPTAGGSNGCRNLAHRAPPCHCCWMVLFWQSAVSLFCGTSQLHPHHLLPAVDSFRKCAGGVHCLGTPSPRRIAAGHHRWTLGLRKENYQGHWCSGVILVCIYSLPRALAKHTG